MTISNWKLKGLHVGNSKKWGVPQKSIQSLLEYVIMTRTKRDKKRTKDVPVGDLLFENVCHLLVPVHEIECHFCTHNRTLYITRS